MPAPDDPLSVEEYRELRATIRQRGSLRLLIVAVTFSVWGPSVLTATALLVPALVALAPLVILITGFEIVFAIHVGVERIGRYVQVRYERETHGPAWERTSMMVPRPRAGIDPLFVVPFTLALLINWTVTLALAPQSASQVAGLTDPTMIAATALHAAALVRWLTAARFARRQRSGDLAAFDSHLGRR